MFKKILVLAPHTDDGEFGAGGAIARFIEEKTKVFYAAFSICEDSVPKRMPRDILLQEVKKATQRLSIPSKRLFIFKFKVREFPRFRQEILEAILKLKKRINPDLVFLPSVDDLHQDHNTLSEEALRVFKDTTVLGYEIPWNNLRFNTVCYIPLEKRHIKKKIEALKCYKSQYFRKYANKDFFINLANMRGMQIGKDYAEVFDVLRLVI